MPTSPEEVHQVKMLWYTNIWEIGATMFELLTLERVEYYFMDQGHDGNLDESALHKRWPYPILMTTILSCLEGDPASRYSIGDLQDRIRGYRNRCVIDKLQFVARQPHDNSVASNAGPNLDTNPEDATRLYYRGNEIEQMQYGSWRRNLSSPDYRTRETDDFYRDPEVRTLIFPPLLPDGPRGDDLDDDDYEAPGPRRDGNYENPIYISSKAAMVGADPQGSRDGHQASPETSASRERHANRDPKGNAAAQARGDLNEGKIQERDGYQPPQSGPHSSAARGGANDSYQEDWTSQPPNSGPLQPLLSPPVARNEVRDSLEEGEIRSGGGEIRPSATQNVSAPLQKVGQAVIRILGLSRPNSEEQGDGELNAGNAGSKREDEDEDEDNDEDYDEEGSLTPSSSSEEAARQEQLGEGEDENDDDDDEEDGRRTPSSSSEEPTAEGRKESPELSMSSRTNPTSHKLMQDSVTDNHGRATTLPSLTGSMFNGSPTFKPLPRPASLLRENPSAGTVDSVVAMYRDAEQEGDVDRVEGLRSTWGRTIRAYGEAEERGDWNTVGAFDDAYQNGRRAGAAANINAVTDGNVRKRGGR